MSDFKMPTAYEDVPCEWTAGIVQREEADGAAVLRAIDQLRRDLSGYHGQLKAHDDLQRHCDNQRKRIVELEFLYAKEKAKNDETSTAFLREYNRAEFLMRQRNELTRQRDELRELVLELWRSCPTNEVDCEKCIHHGGEAVDDWCDIPTRMRELGVEVNE